MTNRKNMIANRYLATQHIGQGGMADVFVALDTILNREVAVKILRGELATDPTAVIRFEREAQASTALSHPNIVDIYDVGEDRGKHYIVMELVRGYTLKRLIAKRGALIKEEAQNIMKQMCSAIAEAHSRGIIHRDIKPQNILIKSDGTIKVVDFGIAVAQNASQLTQKDSVMGSVHYLAPELARGEAATEQSDIYALGIVLFELLTGDVPFKGDQAVNIALAHMREPMPDVRSINPTIPQSMANVVARACAKNKRYRYQNVNEMLRDIQTCLDPDRANEEPLVFNYDGYSKDSKTKVLDSVEDGKGKRSINWTALLVGLLAILAGTGLYFVLSVTGVFKPTVKMVEIPELLGYSVTEAKQICSDMNLQLDTNSIEYELTDDTEKGKIIRVSPEIGTEVTKGSKVSVVVSSGIGVYIDDYVGYNINDAKERISSLYPNMSILTVEEESNEKGGNVIRQELMTAYTRFNPETNTEIRLVYASYPSITIPSYINGMDVDEAVELLKEEGVEVVLSNLDTSNLTQNEIENLVPGVVIKSDPEAGQTYTQSDGAYITIYYYAD